MYSRCYENTINGTPVKSYALFRSKKNSTMCWLPLNSLQNICSPMETFVFIAPLHLLLPFMDCAFVVHYIKVPRSQICLSVPHASIQSCWTHQHGGRGRGWKWKIISFALPQTELSRWTGRWYTRSTILLWVTSQIDKYVEL